MYFRPSLNISMTCSSGTNYICSRLLKVIQGQNWKRESLIRSL